MVSNKAEIEVFLQVITTWDKLENETFFFSRSLVFLKLLVLLLVNMFPLNYFLQKRSFLIHIFIELFHFFCMHLNIIIALIISNYNFNFYNFVTFSSIFNKQNNASFFGHQNQLHFYF